MTEYANNVAKISWNDAENRYEIHILNKLKAFSTTEKPGQENNKETHEQGRKELVELVKEKGYTVINA